MSRSTDELILAAHNLMRTRVAGDRHAHSENPEDPSTVQAMQIALHIPKQDPPARGDLLTAAARAVVAVCLDPRATGEWEQPLTNWYDHLIRKVARRGRNKAWLDVQDVPGVTIDNLARAFVPSPVSEVPAPVKKLQIQGTDLPGGPSKVEPGVILALPASLNMTVGKAAAQAGHGSMLLAAAQSPEWALQWAHEGFPLSVVEHDDAVAEFQQRSDAVVVRDAGFTEVAPDSITCVAVPDV